MKKSQYILISFLLIGLMVSGTACKNNILRYDKEARAAQVDKLFSSWDKPDSPGASLAVIKDGEVIYKNGYGSANLEYGIPITPSTVFHVASVSKQFTAFAAAMLAEQGKLKLDDDIRRYLPEVPDFGKTITIRHLIHHISGMRDQWELLAVAGWRLDDVITREHILKMVRNQRELNFEPGEQYLYCNTGFTLLAEIVARVSGKSFREWTEENIFKPLGMSDSQFYDDHERIVKNRAYSYVPVKENGFKKRRLNYANVGATSLFTTAEDLAKWVKNFEDGRVGGREVIEQMQEQGVLNNGKTISYAFGLVIGEHKGLRTVSHSGGDAGYRSHIVLFPEQRFAVVVFSNLGSFNTSQIARQVADIYLSDVIKEEQPPARQVERREVEPNSALYDTFAGRYYFEPGLIMTFVKENNQLILQQDGGPKVSLVPESDTEFSIRNRGATLTFQLNNVGDVTQLVFTQGDNVMIGEKFEQVELDAQQLKEYTGDFYSDELGTTYTLAVVDGKLTAQHRRHDDIQLNPTKKDMFLGEQWFFRQVRFTRDRENRVTGFRLSGGRIRNLRFDKKVE
jgi:CubicO group peptidase (beta-lactamase class C family)